MEDKKICKVLNSLKNESYLTKEQKAVIKVLEKEYLDKFTRNTEIEIFKKESEQLMEDKTMEEILKERFYMLSSKRNLYRAEDLEVITDLMIKIYSILKQSALLEVTALKEKLKEQLQRPESKNSL